MVELKLLVLRYGKTGNKKRATCFATLLRNELNSDVTRFTTLIKPVNNLICCKTGFIWVVKRATSLFNWFCSNVTKQVGRFLLPVFPYLYYRNNEPQTTTVGKAWSRGT